MSLTPEHIKSLLAKPDKKPRGKKGPDTSIRDIATWFALAPKTREVMRDKMSELKCENPDCLDPRPPIVTAMGNEIKHQFCVEVNGQWTCRYCFLGGWLLNSDSQLSVIDE